MRTTVNQRFVSVHHGTAASSTHLRRWPFTDTRDIDEGHHSRATGLVKHQTGMNATRRAPRFAMPFKKSVEKNQIWAWKKVLRWKRQWVQWDKMAKKLACACETLTTSIYTLVFYSPKTVDVSDIKLSLHSSAFLSTGFDGLHSCVKLFFVFCYKTIFSLRINFQLLLSYSICIDPLQYPRCQSSCTH